MRDRLAGLALALLAGTAAAAQDEPAPGEPAPGEVRVQGPSERAAKMLDATLNGAPVVRPQAAARLATMGAAAQTVVAEHLGEGLDALARSGPELTGVLAQLGSEELRATAWSAAFEDAFPWKPAAVRGLAAEPRAQELDAFLRLTASKLSPVRAEAVQALGRLGDPGAVEALVGLIADPEGAVRRRAAVALADLGRPEYLIVPWHDLTLQEELLDVDSGLRARLDAQALLGRRFPEQLKGYDVRNPLGVSDEGSEAAGDASASALLRVHEALVTDSGASSKLELPLVARPAEGAWLNPTPRRGLGLELLSCRAGDLSLVWSEELEESDALWVGSAPAARVELPEGTVERLEARFSGLVEAREKGDGWSRKQQVLTFGEPGCDRETFRLLGEGRDARALVLRDWDVSTGPRPADLTAFAAELLATLPDAARPDDARLDRLRSRAAAILGAIGGPLRPPPGAGE